MFFDTFDQFASVCFKHCRIHKPDSPTPEDSEVRARRIMKFVREIWILRLLEHENIVKLRHCLLPPENVDQFTEAILIFEGMKESLLDRLQRSGEVPESERASILFQTLCGLLRAHSASVLHRDIVRLILSGFVVPFRTVLILLCAPYCVVVIS